MAIKPQPRTQTAPYIGYYNSKDYPISLAFGGIGTEIPAGYPVTDAEGLLVPHHRILEQLVEQGLLLRIPANHQDFSKWDERTNQRRSANVLPAVRPTARKAKDDVVVSSSRSLPDDPADDLPEGAERTMIGGKSAIQYAGKSFASKAALNAYLG